MPKRTRLSAKTSAATRCRIGPATSRNDWRRSSRRWRRWRPTPGWRRRKSVASRPKRNNSAKPKAARSRANRRRRHRTNLIPSRNATSPIRNDVLKHAGRGSVVNAGQGLDTFGISNDILISGAKPTDKIVNAGGIVEHGGIGQIGSESPWIVGSDNTSYAIDSHGELAIKDTLGNITYVANYQGGLTVKFEQQTTGIFVSLGSVHVERLMDIKRPYEENIPITFKLGAEEQVRQ